jgi:hypothetical protein
LPNQAAPTRLFDMLQHRQAGLWSWQSTTHQLPETACFQHLAGFLRPCTCRYVNYQPIESAILPGVRIGFLSTTHQLVQGL